MLDFYFPLPDTIHRASQLPRFDLLWQGNTPQRTVASRTGFARLDREPDYVYEARRRPGRCGRDLRH